MNLEHLNQIGIEAAVAAGRVIQQHMDDVVSVEQKEAGTSRASQVVTEVDRACERAIFRHILPTCEAFDLALLSEETEDDGSRFRKDYFWCIDPLDGTLPFTEQRPGFSVSIALVARDGTPFLGIVYDPVTETLYHARKGKGVYKNDSPWQLPPPSDYLTYVTDRRLRDTPRVDEIKALLHESAVKLGLIGYRELSGAGSVLNAIRVLENRPALMLKFPKKEKGGGSIWDFAATACLFQELGLPATNFAGGRLDLNREEGTFMHREGVYYEHL
jgi:fructose-1,6-bisphosphatase/inositol monophosphatase family enzyme